MNIEHSTLIAPKPLHLNQGWKVIHRNKIVWTGQCTGHLVLSDIQYCWIPRNKTMDLQPYVTCSQMQNSRSQTISWHDNRFEVNWRPKPTLVLHWISKFFLFGALPIDTLKMKHTKNLKEIPSRHFLEKLLEKSKHSCLYTSETHWQFTGILPIYNGRHAKSYNSGL